MREIPINDNFPGDFHEALARLLIEFGRLEYLTALCIKDMTGKGFDAGMLAALRQGPFGGLHKYALKIAPDALTHGELPVFLDYMARADRMNSYRTDSVHAYWTMENDHVMRVRPRKGDDITSIDWTHSRSVTVEEISGKADDMRQLRWELDRDRLNWECRAQAGRD